MKIAVTGTPGVGKTTVSKILAEKFGLKHIEVSRFALEKNLVLGMERDSYIVDEKKLKKILDKMDDIVIDSHFSELFEADFVFVLRCNPKILLKRLKEKKYEGEKIKENLMAEVLDYNLAKALKNHDRKKVFEIINENLDIAVSEIFEIIVNPKNKGFEKKSKCNFLSEENLDLIESI